jgi:two-component system sensor histidine kinase RegB
MRITDQGPGMSAEHLQRVSEPFFTTKPPGKGMGLGVFLAQNVVHRLGGTIQFQSQPGAGTTVIVELPSQ